MQKRSRATLEQALSIALFGSVDADPFLALDTGGSDSESVASDMASDDVGDGELCAVQRHGLEGVLELLEPLLTRRLRAFVFRTVRVALGVARAITGTGLLLRVRFRAPADGGVGVRGLRLEPLLASKQVLIFVLTRLGRSEARVFVHLPPAASPTPAAGVRGLAGPRRCCFSAGRCCSRARARAHRASVQRRRLFIGVFLVRGGFAARVAVESISKLTFVWPTLYSILYGTLYS